jgi:hypothetical protein
VSHESSWGPIWSQGIEHVTPLQQRSKAACLSAALVFGKFRMYQTFIWIVANAKESGFFHKFIKL